MGKSSINGSCTMAMLNYQRVMQVMSFLGSDPTWVKVGGVWE